MACQPSTSHDLKKAPSRNRRCQSPGLYSDQFGVARCSEVDQKPKQLKALKETTPAQRREEARVFSEWVRRRNSRKQRTAISEGCDAEHVDTSCARQEESDGSSNKGRDTEHQTISKFEKRPANWEANLAQEKADVHFRRNLEKVKSLAQKSEDSIHHLLQEKKERLTKCEKDIAALQHEVEDLCALVEDCMHYSRTALEGPISRSHSEEDCKALFCSRLSPRQSSKIGTGVETTMSECEQELADQHNQSTDSDSSSGFAMDTISKTYWNDNEFSQDVSFHENELWTSMENIILPDLDNFVPCIHMAVNQAQKSPGCVYFSPAYDDEYLSDEAMGFFRQDGFNDYEDLEPELICSSLVDDHALGLSETMMDEYYAPVMMQTQCTQPSKPGLDESCVLITVRREGTESLNLVAASTVMEWLLFSCMSTKPCFGMNYSEALESGGSKKREDENSFGIIQDQLAKKSNRKENLSLVRQIICQMDLLTHYNTAGSCGGCTIWTIVYRGHDFQTSAKILFEMAYCTWRSMHIFGKKRDVLKHEENPTLDGLRHLSSRASCESNIVGCSSERETSSTYSNQDDEIVKRMEQVIRTLQIWRGIIILIHAIELCQLGSEHLHLDPPLEGPVSNKEKKNSSLARGLYGEVRKGISAITVLISKYSSADRLCEIRKRWRSAKAYFKTPESSGSLKKKRRKRPAEAMSNIRTINGN